MKLLPEYIRTNVLGLGKNLQQSHLTQHEFQNDFEKQADTNSLLQKNTEATILFAKRISTKEADDQGFTPLPLPERSESVIDTLYSDQKSFSKAIENLTRIHDSKSNIISYISESLDDGARILVRDGRNAINPPKTHQESFVIEYLNHTRTAMDVANKEGKSLEDNFLEKIKDNCKELLTSPIENTGEVTNLLNSRLAISLGNAGVENPIDKIKKSKDFMNLQDEHYHVATLHSETNEQNKLVTVIQSSVMNLGLTKEQKAMFTAIATDENPDNIDLSWYTTKSDLEKKQIKEASSQIILEKKVVPSQLRFSIPAARNSYTTTTSVIKDGNRKDILNSSHSGTLSIHTGDFKQDQQLTTMACDQLHQVTSTKSKSLDLTLLTSPINTFDIDNRENQLIQDATRNTSKFTKNNTPYNSFRFLFGGGRDFQGYQNSLGDVGKELIKQDQFIAIGAFLKSTAEYQSDPYLVKEELSKIKKTNPEAHKVISAAVDAKGLMYSSNSIFSKRNLHLDINSHMMSISSQANDENSPLRKFLPKLDINKINISCLSGKDRTQMQQIDATRYATNNELGLNEKSPQAKENLSRLLSASHAQFLAGTQGGSVGCFGILPQTAKRAHQDIYADFTNYISFENAKRNKFITEPEIIKDELPTKSKNIFLLISEKALKAFDGFSKALKLGANIFSAALSSSINQDKSYLVISEKSNRQNLRKNSQNFTPPAVTTINSHEKSAENIR